MNKNTLRTGTVMALALSAMMTGQAWAGGVDTTVAVEYNDAEVQQLSFALNDPNLQWPSSIQIATIENKSQRLYFTRVLDSVKAIQNADLMTPEELVREGSKIIAQATAFQAGMDAAGGFATITDKTSTSCVQTCKNEFNSNMRACNGAFWCEVEANALATLCLLDCLIPGQPAEIQKLN